MKSTNDMREFAGEAISCMLEYNVTPREAYTYLTNEIKLCDTSYELQCCIFDLDPVEYFRQYNKRKYNT